MVSNGPVSAENVIHARVEEQRHSNAVLPTVRPTFDSVENHVDPRDVVCGDVALLGEEHETIRISAQPLDVSSRLEQQTDRPARPVAD